MAEEFVIRVQVEQLQGRSTAPRTGPNAQQSDGTGVNNPNMAEVQGRIRKLHSMTGLDIAAYDERITKNMIGRKSEDPDLRDAEFLNRGFVKGSGFQRRRIDVVQGMDTLLSQEQETLYGAFSSAETGVAGFLNQNRARIRAGVSIAVNSAVRANINIKNHRSGNSYRNEQRQLTASAVTSLSSIGIAGFVWGPSAAIAFAINAGVSTAANIVTENANFKYDRMMDTLYIHNIKQVAGDISYGRNRRGDR